MTEQHDEPRMEKEASYATILGYSPFSPLLIQDCDAVDRIGTAYCKSARAM